MKRLCLILPALAFLPSLQAQDKPVISASQTQPITTEKSVAPVRTPPQKSAATNVDTEGWQTTGLIYEISEKGLIIISPTAPASLGYGNKAILPPGATTPLAAPQINTNDRAIDGLVVVGWSW